MRFPLRLTADLTLGLAARSLRLKRDRPLIVNLAAGSSVNHSVSPVVWIGGPEPLDLAETPRVVNSLAGAGRHVFLPTSGVLLRRRIHEFQPSQRLHLTIRFDGSKASHDARADRGRTFRDSLESARTARLSGFLLCAQLILHTARDASELDRLHGELSKLDFDGFLISLAEPVAANDELRRNLAGLRRRLLGRRWALLSRLLDSILLQAPAAVAAPQSSSSRIPDEFTAQMPLPGREESVQAP